MSEKDKVINFEELKKNAENKKEAEVKKETESKNIGPEMGDHGFLKFMEDMGFPIDDSMNKHLLEALNSKEVMDIVNKLDLNNFDLSSINKIASEMKDIEEKYKREQVHYRTFGQWQNFYKPYKFEALYPIEFLRELAQNAGIALSGRESKNEIISKISSNLAAYLENLFKLMDRESMNLIGKIIYSEGELEFNKVLKEKEELKIDFLTTKCVLARVKSNGSHNLVIPKDIMDQITKIDFTKIDKYNKLNSMLIKATIGYVNSYGIIPYKILVEKLEDLVSDEISILEGSSFEEHLNKLYKFVFSNSIVKRGLYPNIIVDEEYVHHAVVGFTQSLIDIQNESIKEYKEYDYKELEKRGDSYYFEESLHLSQIIESITKLNDVREEDVEDLKNLIFTFSKLEFEPSLIIKMLEINYELPESSKYESFIETFRDFYKNSEKWILKGYTPYESNKAQDEKISNFDASKIVNIDFNKR